MVSISAEKTQAFFTVFFLILGTSIGAGMMTLPLLVQAFSLVQMSLVLGAAACVMGLVGFIWLNLSYHFDQDANLATYIKELAPLLLYPTHLAYLLFFWSLMAYYLSVLPTFLSPYFGVPFLQYPLFYGLCLWGYLMSSSQKQGLLNQIAVWLMFGCLAWIIVYLTAGQFHFQTTWPLRGESSWDIFVPLMMFFGYHLSIPSFRVYGLSRLSFEWLIVLGGLGTLMIYWVWSWLLLSFISQSSEPILSQNGLIHYLLSCAQNQDVLQPIALFSFFATWTSCLGMSMGTCAYLKDCIKGSRLQIALVTALPPLILLYWSSGMYQRLLEVASVLALYLLICLPAYLNFVLGQRRYQKWSWLSLGLGCFAFFLIGREFL